MEQRKAANILDGAFSVMGIWLLAFLWTRYYVRNILMVLLVATSITLCVALLFNLRKKKSKRNKKKQRIIDQTIQQFVYNDERFALDFFKKALQKKYNVTAKKNYLKIHHTLLFVSFQVKCPDFQDIIKLYTIAMKERATKLVLLTACGCDKKTMEETAKLPDLEIVVWDKLQVYGLMHWLNEFPALKFQFVKQKRSLKTIFANALTPEKSKRYLFISFLFMISSYFVQYSVYYIVMASVCMLLTILSRFDILKRIHKSGTGKKNKA